MTETTDTPRRPVETDPIRALAGQLADLRKIVARQGKTANLRNSSISDSSGTVRLRFSTDEGAIIAYSADGEEVARYGLLAHSDPGQYGIEALSGGEWVHVGDESVTWANIAGRPDTFAPILPIAATDVSGTIAEAAHAAQADGSAYGFTNTVSGSTFYALWVGDDGGYHFGRNVSSIRYKENVRDLDSSAPLAALRPVVYDRKPTLRPALTAEGAPAEGPAYQSPGARDEFGLIAEEVHPYWPEVVTWFDDGDGPAIDGIRYDLIGPRLIPYVQELQTTVATYGKKLAAQDKLIQELVLKVNALEGK